VTLANRGGVISHTGLGADGKPMDSEPDAVLRGGHDKWYITGIRKIERGA
jgi:hypothetical protein